GGDRGAGLPHRPGGGVVGSGLDGRRRRHRARTRARPRPVAVPPRPAGPRLPEPRERVDAGRRRRRPGPRRLVRRPRRASVVRAGPVGSVRRRAGRHHRRRRGTDRVPRRRAGTARWGRGDSRRCWLRRGRRVDRRPVRRRGVRHVRARPNRRARATGRGTGAGGGGPPGLAHSARRHSLHGPRRRGAGSDRRAVDRPVRRRRLPGRRRHPSRLPGPGPAVAPRLPAPRRRASCRRRRGVQPGCRRVDQSPQPAAGGAHGRLHQARAAGRPPWTAGTASLL
ncbi:MAG: hypothetical protein AVDCRST_MAG50-3267, partial [uncultured Acidimicrobiales bacterium]